MTSTFADILQRRLSRRTLLKGSMGAVALTALPGLRLAAESIASSFTPLPFARGNTDLQLAEGYTAQVLLKWGDRLTSIFDSFPLRPAFGFNNDFTAYFPVNGSSAHGLLCVNHEYVIPSLMFAGAAAKTGASLTSDQLSRCIESVGVSIVDIERKNEKWEINTSPYNRRITATTQVRIAGPASGHARLKTSYDATGTNARGTLANCAGGVTPWDTYLTAEENFDMSFHGLLPESHPEYRNHARYGVGRDDRNGWHRIDPRFNVEKEPNEANRFGWIVEIDPYAPESTPVKRTALGRFKHECATCALCPDGRVAVYSGDDEPFEYLYRFVSTRAFDAGNPPANRDLLDDGTLYAAQFTDDGTMRWLPLVFGHGPLNESNGFSSLADILIETRRAADLLGATPMDRPEDIEVEPVTGRVFIALTNNRERMPWQTDAANPRGPNPHGHILVLIPPNGDHAQEEYRWEILLQGGDPQALILPGHYRGDVPAEGYLSAPDNLAFDPSGNLWIASDGQPHTLGASDSLYRCDARGVPARFLNAPRGAEVTGPSFTPDGTTLFLSIQHPADEKGSTFDEPSTRWPEFQENMPPKPSVIAIRRKDGGTI